jgi:hypothetical protein
VFTGLGEGAGFGAGVGNTLAGPVERADALEELEGVNFLSEQFSNMSTEIAKVKAMPSGIRK